MNTTWRTWGMRLLALLLVLGIWQLLTCFYPPIVVPKIGDVMRHLGAIFSQESLSVNLLITLDRWMRGLLGGTCLALVASVVITRWIWLEELLYPIIRFMQAVPPVSWLVLAIIWFGFSGIPATFIVALSTFSIVTIALINGIHQIDAKLLQVGDIFALSRGARLRYIILPSIWDSFKTAFIVCLGISSKMIVMGEVLSTTNGIGGEIQNARVNLEPGALFAWSITIVLLYALCEGFFLWLVKRKCLRNWWFRGLRSTSEDVPSSASSP